MERLESFFEKQQGKFPKTLTRRELAYERIRDAIRTAEILPGEALTEVRLIKTFRIKSYTRSRSFAATGARRVS